MDVRGIGVPNENDRGAASQSEIYAKVLPPEPQAITLCPTKITSLPDSEKGDFVSRRQVRPLSKLFTIVYVPSPTAK